MADLSNWIKSSTSSRVYNKDTTLPVGSDLLGNALRRPGNPDPVKQNLRIETNIDTGSYVVFATGTKQLGLQGTTAGTDITIYTYDATNNKTIINNDDYYDRIINSSLNAPVANNTKTFNSNIKIDTFSLARNNQVTDADKSSFQTLKRLTGYQSASNISQQAPQSVTQGADPTASGLNPQDGGSNTSSDPNTDLYGNSTGMDSRISLLSTGDSAINIDRSFDNKDAQYLRYPEGIIPNLGYDYIQISSYEYVAVGVPLGYGQGTTKSPTRKAADRLYKNVQDVIQLPMIGSISETNAVSWTEDRINEINNIAAGIAYNNMINQNGSVSDPFSATFGAITDMIKSVSTAAMEPDVQRSIAAFFAGQASSVPSTLKRAEGKMINNNLELLFNGPNLRTFNFAFKFRPRTPTEAQLIRKIIRSFKKSSAPKRSDDFLFLETPMIYRIQYIHSETLNDRGSDRTILVEDKEHPFMNKLKPCALTGLNVNYTPDGSYMTYDDGGSMTGYDLSLTFKELEPIYRDDQEGTSDNMGY